MSSMVFPWVYAAPNWQVAQKWWDVASKIRRLWLPFCPTPPLPHFLCCELLYGVVHTARNEGSLQPIVSVELRLSVQQPQRCWILPTAYKGDREQMLPQVKPDSDCTLTSTLTTACQGSQPSHMQVPNSQRLWNSKWLLSSTTEFRDNLLCSKR